MNVALLGAAADQMVVDDGGVHLPASVDDVLVLRFDGEYAWAFAPHRDGQLADGRVSVPWPPVLRPFLDGASLVTVGRADGRDLFAAEVRLGSGVGRVRVVDAAGRALAVDKVGHLGRSFAAVGEHVRDEILGGTARLIEQLTDDCEVRAYLNYGALLGAIRDGAMIAHDSDTDVCYLSRHSSPADLIGESYRIERTLRGLGWRVLRMSGGDIKILLPLSDGRHCHIDVFVAFHVGGTFYQLGNRSGQLPVSAILPFSRVELHGHVFPAPARPEQMLEFVYGAGWRQPDPSFKYADPVAGIRRLDGWLRGFRTDMGRWSEFYSSPEGRRVPRARSDFVRWVGRRLPEGAAIAELGAGNGRDAFWLARRGFRVTAYEFSRVALTGLRTRSRRRARRAPGDRVTVRPLMLNELRSALVAGAELARQPHHLYARQLLGCLDEDARANLWRICRIALGSGGALFLEFSATGPGAPVDPTPVDPGPAGLVRRVSADSVIAEISASGGTVVHCRSGPGADMLDQPDPYVCRIIAHWRKS